MFLNNRYYRIYQALCDRARNRVVAGYTEKHHVLPKSLGGSNSKENLVRLTAREHYVSHLCLVRCTTGLARQKMLSAALWFKTRPQVTSGRMYAVVREEYAKTMLGHTRNVGNKHPLSTRLKMSKSLLGNTRNLGHTQSTETKLKKSLALKGRPNSRKGLPLSEATKQKMRAAQLGKPKGPEHRQMLREAALRQWERQRCLSDAQSTTLEYSHAT